LAEVRSRVTPDEAALGGEAEHELQTPSQAGAAQLGQRSVPAAFEVRPLEIAAAAQDRAAVLRQLDLLQRTAGRERQADPGIALQRGADAGQNAVLAAEAGGQVRSVVIALFQRV